MEVGPLIAVWLQRNAPSWAGKNRPIRRNQEDLCLQLLAEEAACRPPLRCAEQRSLKAVLQIREAKKPFGSGSF